MEKIKNNQGILSIEAAIVLCTILFLMLFIFNFGYVYRAQNYVVHGVLETSKGLSFKSYQYDVENSQYILETAKAVITVLGYESDEGIIKQKWTKKDYAGAANLYFTNCFSDLPTLGKYNITSVDFSNTKKDGNDLVVICTYTIDLPFKVFNVNSITLHQESRMGLWQ